MENDEKKAVDDLKTAYQKVEAELHGERMMFLRAKLLYTSLFDVIEDDGSNEPNNVDEDDMIKEITEHVMQSEMKCCLHMLPNAVKKKESTISTESQAFLVKMMKRDLETKCKDLLEFYENKNPDSYANQTVFEARALHIGELLEQEQKKLKMLHHEIEDLQKHENDLLLSCVKQLSESAKILIEMLTKFKLDLQPKLDATKFENLISQCELFGLKAVNISWNLKKDLYNETSVPALKVIQSELIRSQQSKLEETSAIEEKLRDFKTLGDEFNSIVTEYSQILDKIEKREWTLQKFDSEITPN